jgi:hypothetical protein
MDVVAHVRAEKGLAGLYKGMVPTLTREMAGNAVMFGVYEYLKQQLAKAQARAWLHFNPPKPSLTPSTCLWLPMHAQHPLGCAAP